MLNNPLSTVALAVSALMITAACGYGNGNGDGDGDVTTPVVGEGPTVQATIKDFTLPDLTVAVGTTVTWTNEDGAPHTTTSGQDGTFDGAGWNSSQLSKGESFGHTFNQVGTFPYTCRVHPSLSGTITVTEATGQNPGASSTSSPDNSPATGVSFY